MRGPSDRTAIADAALKIPEAEPWPERSGIEEMAAAVGAVTSRKTRPEGRSGTGAPCGTISAFGDRAPLLLEPPMLDKHIAKWLNNP